METENTLENDIIIEVKGFDLSKDYDLLWELINKGFRIPAWLNYEKGNSNIRDIVEVRFNPWNKYSMGVRGIGYEGFNDGKEGFIETCKCYELEFILPQYEI